MLCFAPTAASPATFTVTTTVDTADGACDTDCSLREAIIAANRRPGHDTVIVPAGTYVLSLHGSRENEAAVGDLDVRDDLTLSGAGPEATRIEAVFVDRVLDVHPGAVVRLTSLTIQNGLSDEGDSDTGGGGGVRNSGTLTLLDCAVSDNRHNNTRGTGGGGGGIANLRGDLTLLNCTVTGNGSSGPGGGIWNYSGTLTLENSTISSNRARNGGGGIASLEPTMLNNSTVSNNTAGACGGIDSAGTLILTNSTISGNSTFRDENYTPGGGICVAGSATLTHCTVSDNVSGGPGAGLLIRGTANLTNCTISGNWSRTVEGYGGGIYILPLFPVDGFGTATLTNCTLNNNVASNGCGSSLYIGALVSGDVRQEGTARVGNTIFADSYPNCGGHVQCGALVRPGSTGHNLDDDGSCGLSNTGDLSGTGPLAGKLPAHLGPLGNYGGPTHTHALCTGLAVPHPDCTAASPAIDAGDGAQCPNTDQRGRVRPHGAACDIGAFESGALAPPSPTPTLTATPRPTPTPGPCYGDCDGNGRVTIDELVRGVRIALDTQTLAACPAADGDRNGRVTINDLIRAVNAALAGCIAG